MTTIREHLTTIRDECFPGCEGSYRPECECVPCIAYREAVAALAALDEAETAWRDSGDTYRLIPDTVTTEAKA